MKMTAFASEAASLYFVSCTVSLDPAVDQVTTKLTLRTWSEPSDGEVT